MLSTACVTVNTVTQIPKAKSDYERKLERDRIVDRLEVQIHNMDYAANQAMINLHIDLKTYEEQDYFDLQRVLSTNKPAEEMADAGDLVRRLGGKFGNAKLN